jgi:hypothetical protein
VDIEGGESVIIYDVKIVTIITVTIMMIMMIIINGRADTYAYSPLHIHLSVVASLRYYLLDSGDGLQERERERVEMNTSMISIVMKGMGDNGDSKIR